VAKNFVADELILEIDDSDVVTNPPKLTGLEHELELDYIENGKIVRMKPPERHINHPYDPNSYVKTVNGVRGLFAVRYHQKSEEITNDYSINGYNEGTFECRCGSKNCRKTYQGNFFKLPKHLQIKYLPYLDDWFKKQFKKRVETLIAKTPKKTNSV
jgi:hypothetical protein